MPTLLHSKSQLVSLEEIAATATPEPTATWHPIPHIQLIREVQSSLGEFGMTIANERHALYHGESGADRYFGVFDLKNTVGGADDYAIAVGMRNSHDQTFPAALVLGSHVFVCDNLAFSGEVKIARKHTRWIERDLPRLVLQASGKIVEAMGFQTKRIDAYKEMNITKNAQASHLIVLAVHKGILPARLLTKVVDEWAAPKYPEFEPRTHWSLFNAFTEVLKQTTPVELPKRTQALHGLFDQSVGLLSGPSLN